MSGLRKRLCLVVLLCLFVAPTLSGCASSGEPTLASAVAHSGVVDGVVEGLKAADDEAENKRMQAEEPSSPQEREEVREGREQVAMEANQAASGESYAPTSDE